jgi:hypothetical protein
VKTCQDTWINGECLGGYCSKGEGVALPEFKSKESTLPEFGAKDQPEKTDENRNIELHLYNVSPALKLEIQNLIDKGL